MKLRLEGCSNSGLSFTEVRKEQLLEFADWIEKHNKDGDKTYKQIQKEMENECNGFNASKVRMFFPFLRKLGCIKNDGFEKRNSLINLEDLFTDEGKCFIEYLKLVKKIGFLERKDINEKMNRINELFSTINLINIICNDELIYLDVIKFLKKYKRMDRNEFFLMTTLKNKYQGHDYDIKLNKAIKKYRNKVFKRIEIIKHEQSYNYIKSFLIESNLVVQVGTSLELNRENLDILNTIL